MKDDEFLQWLELISDNGISQFLDYYELNQSIIPENYRLVFDTLISVGKIGNGDLRPGIDRINGDYPNIYPKQEAKPANAPPMLTGRKRAIVDLVENKHPQYDNYPDTCMALGIEHESYKKYKQFIKKQDKLLADNNDRDKIIMNDKLLYLDSLVNKGFQELTKEENIQETTIRLQQPEDTKLQEKLFEPLQEETLYHFIMDKLIKGE